MKKTIERKDLVLLGFIALSALLPAVSAIRENSLTMHVILMVFLMASMSQAWNIIGGYCGQVSFGHSVFFGIGAYGAGMAVVKYGLTPWPGMAVGVVLAAAAGVLISWPVFRLSGHYFAIATFAIVEIFNRLFMVWYWVGGAIGLDYSIQDQGLASFTWYQSKVGYYYGALIIFVIVFGIVRWMERHRIGYYLRAVREGQETAEALGVDSTKTKLCAMAVSAALAALCGAFFAQYNYRVDPPMVMSLDMSMKFVLVTILGGSGTLFGPLLGAAVLVPLQEYTRAFWGGMGGGVDLIIFGLLIIVVVVKQPRGIMGLMNDFVKWRRKKSMNQEGGE
ncbi:MAG: branched-chain amino acid ABC transporter permease [Thermovirgaceae bacterium]